MLLPHRPFIRLALVSLLLGVGTGALLEIRQALGYRPWPRGAVTVQTHLLTPGFLLNMVISPFAIWRRVRFLKVRIAGLEQP